MVNSDVPPVVIVVGLKALATVGGALTVSGPCPAAPVPALKVVMEPVELLYVPAVGAVTSTLMVQFVFAVIVPVVILPKFSTKSPGLGVKLPDPQPTALALGVAATCIWPGAVGSVSWNVTPVMSMAAFGLVIIMVRVL